MKEALLKKMKGRRGLITAAGVTLLIALLTAFFFDYYFDLNDDVLIKDILAGVQTGTPSGYSIQMLYPISVFISLFYRAAPGVDWYGLFLCGCQYACIFLVIDRSLQLQGRPGRRAVNAAGLSVVLGVLLCGLFLRELVFVQYTVTCGMLTATAVFLFYTTPAVYGTGQFLKSNVISILFLLTAFSIRTEMFLLLLPLLGAAGLGKWLREGFVKQSRKYGLVIILTAAGLVLCGAGDMAAYRSPQWQEFRRVFHARTQLYDFYGIPDYEEHAAFYESIGMSREEYTLLENYNYGAADTINADRLEQIEAYAGEWHRSSKTTGERLRDALWEYKQLLLLRKDGIFGGIVLFSYLCAAAGLLCAGNAGFLWQLLLLFAGRSVSWFYILYRGRVVGRITVPLYLTELLILCGIFWMECRQRERTAGTPVKPVLLKRYSILTALLFFFWGICLLPGSIRQVREEQVQREQVNLANQELAAYCWANPENYYYVDVYSTVTFSEKMFEKVDNSRRNYDIIGGWACKSPLSGSQPFRYLITDSRRDASWLEAYYGQARPEVLVEKADTFGGPEGTVWEVYEIRDRQE